MSEWKLPDSWRSESLGFIADIVFSNVDKKTVSGEKPVVLCNYMNVYSNEYITHHLDFMEATANSTEIARFSVQKGDVIATKDSETPDEIGIPAVVVEDIPNLICGYHLAQIKPRCEFVDPIFLSKQIAHDRIVRYFSRLANGSTRYGLSTSSFEKMPVWLPVLQKQRKIARILTTLDELIEKTESLIAKYQVIKQGLMHDLFTRGVNEHGHLRPSFDESHELYKESEIGWIPKDWECKELLEVVPRAEYGISISMDGDPRGVPVLRMNNLSEGHFDLSDLKYSSSTQAARLQLREKDVLFNRTNSFEHVGRTSMWRGELSECSFASYLVRLHPDIERLTPLFLTLWLNLPATQIAIRQFATPGVHQVNINPTNLRRVKIAFPRSSKEQGAISDIVERTEHRITLERQYLDKLRLQKKGLMQDLLTGKVDVTVDEKESTHV